MTDNWTPNRRACQPKRKGHTDHIVHLINLLCELVDCPECKLCAPMRQRAERLLTEHYGHVSHQSAWPPLRPAYSRRPRLQVHPPPVLSGDRRRVLSSKAEVAAWLLLVAA